MSTLLHATAKDDGIYIAWLSVLAMHYLFTVPYEIQCTK